MLHDLESLKAQIRAGVCRQKASAKLKAEREAEARAPRVAGRVSEPYRVVRPWSGQPTLEAPHIQQSTNYDAPERLALDTLAFHQRLNGSGVAQGYSLSRAEWGHAPALEKGPDVARRVVNVANPGRAGETRKAALKPTPSRHLLPGNARVGDAFHMILEIAAEKRERVARIARTNPGRSAEIRATAPCTIAARPEARAASARVAPFAFVEKVGAVKGWNVWRSARASGLTGYVIVSKSGTVLSIINDAASFVVFAQIWGTVGQ
jgi:hypothetical protein